MVGSFSSNEREEFFLWNEGHRRDDDVSAQLRNDKKFWISIFLNIKMLKNSRNEIESLWNSLENNFQAATKQEWWWECR